MADFDPDAFLANKPDAAASAPAFDPDAYLAPQRKGYFGNVAEVGGQALDTLNRTLNPWSAPFKAERERQLREGMTVGEAVGVPTLRGIGAAAELAASPITAAYKTAAPYVADVEARLIQLAGEPIARSLSDNPVLPTTAEISRQITPDVETALGMIGARPGMPTGGTMFRPSLPPRPPLPPPPGPPSGPFGVALSEGQATGDLAAIQREQAALRGTSGPVAQTVAQEFADEQTAQLAAAKGDITKSLDTLGQQIVAAGPQEAGEAVSAGVTRAAKTAKAGVTQAYETARGYPGEVHADVFREMNVGIRDDLGAGTSPVVVDDKLTPYASRMLKDIDDRVSVPRIQNQAATSSPIPSTISGITLDGVDQMRKRLSAMRRDAYASGNAADGRAARAVLDAFDDRIDAAVNGGKFNGDPRAIQAWNDARAAYADYRSTFTAGKNDPVGRVVERILGKGNNPAAHGNDVADFIYGRSGVNANTRDVAVAQRIKNILGEDSAGWVGARQGLFSRLTETPPGVKDWGPGKVANRIGDFLNGGGKELARVMYSSQERATLQRYADLMRQLEVPQAGANWSNTATFLQKIGNQVTSNMAALFGGGLGHMLGLPYVGEIGGMAAGKGAAKLIGKIGERREAAAVSALMPTAATQVRQWQKAVQRAQGNPSPVARAGVTAASANLGQTLKRMGIPALEAPATGHAQEGQNDVPRPPAEQKHGGRVGQQEGVARQRGGKVNHRPITPQSLGARKAKDGKWYVRDPNRPGKYLRVEMRG